MFYRLVILDFDNTLVGRSGVVTEVVKEAIRKTTAKGVKVCISTGRSSYSVKPFIREMNLNVPHVFLAGALVENTIKETILYEDPIPKSVVLSVNDFSFANSMFMELSTKNHLYYNFETQKYIDRRKRITNEPSDLTDVGKLLQNEDILNLRFYLDDESKKISYEKFRQDFKDKLNFQEGTPHDDPNLNIVNMTDIAVSKVSALRKLCQYFKISPEETIAAGDSPIDLGMIEHVGMGVAMGNAHQIVKDKADWIAPGVYQDGVAAVLEKFILKV